RYLCSLRIDSSERAVAAERHPHAVEASRQARARTLSNLNRREHGIGLRVELAYKILRLVRYPDVIVDGHPVGFSGHGERRLGFQSRHGNLSARRFHTSF